MSLYHDVIEALTPLVEAFDKLGIVYYIGGSVSSSLHGMARRTQDVYLIADIEPNQIRPLAQVLQNDYYLDEQAWKDAIQRSLPYRYFVDLGKERLLARQPTSALPGFFGSPWTSVDFSQVSENPGSTK